MKTALNGHTTPIILSAKNVEVKFNLRGKTLTAVRGASLDLYKGETLAIVGESGCGKSVFTKSFTRMSSTRQKINLCKSRNPKLSDSDSLGFLFLL